MRLYLEILLCAVLTVVALALVVAILSSIWEMITKKSKDEEKKEVNYQHYNTADRPGTERPEEGIPLSGRE